MKKTMIILIFSLLFINTYPIINHQDSIYHDLCLFLASKHEVVENLLKEKNVDYKSMISMHDVLEKFVPSNWPDLSEEFGIYNFQYSYTSSHFSYILFKSENRYRVYGISDLSIIIHDLLQYKEKYPELIDDKLFSLYVEKLYAIPTEMNFINIKKFGKITYYSSSPIDE